MRPAVGADLHAGGIGADRIGSSALAVASSFSTSSAVVSTAASARSLAQSPRAVSHTTIHR